MPKPIQNYLYFRILAKGKVILLQIAIFSFFLDTLYYPPMVYLRKTQEKVLRGLSLTFVITLGQHDDAIRPATQLLIGKSWPDDIIRLT